MELHKMALSGIRPYENNPRSNDGAVDAVAESIRQCSYISPIVVDENGVILAGHTRYKALQKLGYESADVLVREGLTEEQKRKFRVLDNKVGELAAWDVEKLEIELCDIDLEGFDFGFDFACEDADPEGGRDAEWFRDRERYDNDGIDEEDEEYQEFVEKFKDKRTTDDCYTPDRVYEAVADWVAREYQLERKSFVRPFYPGGDFRSETYAPGAVVVDNPPFSILAEILKFYYERGIRFFLFAPALTMFSTAASECACALATGVTVTYENGAEVSTSFLTNLEDNRMRLCPSLYEAVKRANDAEHAEKRRELPKYAYPDCVLTAAMAQRFCKYGISMTLKREDSAIIDALDAQKEAGKGIFGKGFLLSEKAAAEKAAAEKAAAEKAAAIQWALSEREQEICRSLGQKEA